MDAAQYYAGSMKKSFIVTILSLLLNSFVFANSNPKLCTAIRGNGELVFAHWSSLARVVEHYGPIDKLAGGSSAAITLFLYESIAKNPNLSCPSLDESCMKKRSLEISLLLKSLQGYFDYWLTTPDLENIKLLFSQSSELVKRLTFWKKRTEEKLNKDLSTRQLFKAVKSSAKELLSSEDMMNVINPELKEYVRDQYRQFKSVSIVKIGKKLKEAKKLKFRLLEAVASIKLVVAGGFDAKNDKRLFFRPGIVSFEDVADKFGRIADFYAAYFYPKNEINSAKRSHIEKVNNKVKNFLNICAPGSQGKSWTELAYSDYESNKLSKCGELHRDAVHHYRMRLMNDRTFKIKRNHRINDEVSDMSFPTTAILNQEQTGNYLKKYDEYLNTTDKNFGLDWNVPFESVSFGYWGNKKDLDQVKSNLSNGPYSDLEKSKKMKSLGRGRWSAVLATSPAEPGLSKLKMIPDGRGIMSVGGWSDLHPTVFLKSMNCENVVYITRVNGETVFGQGVVKRLLNLESPSWDRIDPKGGDQTRERNNNGDPTDMNSMWSKLYNIANPESSYAKSVSVADAVWCTDWDTLAIQNGYTHVLDHGYDSKLYINKDSSSRRFFEEGKFELGGFNRDGFLLEKSDQTFENGWPSYVGCIPLQ